MNRKQRRAINRANAALSTGPSTEAGKLASSQNALKHGLTAFKPYLPSEAEAYEKYASDTAHRLAPVDSYEMELVETIIDLAWRLKRVSSVESRLFESEVTNHDKFIRSLEVLSRHEARLRKQLKATTTEFQNVQAARKMNEHHALPEIGFVLPEEKPQPPKAAIASAKAFLEDHQRFMDTIPARLEALKKAQGA